MSSVVACPNRSPGCIIPAMNYRAPLISALLASAAIAACATGGQKPASTVIPAERLQIRDSVVFYDVDGQTPYEVYQSMVQRGPKTRRGWALATFQGSWRSTEQYVQTGPACVVNQRFAVSNVITLPRWRWMGQAPADIQRSWNSFMLQIRDHENLHRSIFLAGVDSIYLAVGALAAPNCAALRPMVRETMERMKTYINREQATFDATDEMDRKGWPP